MAEDKGNEEEKFDFTPAGEGYISLDAAIVNARRLVRQDEQHYLDRTGWEEIVWSTKESDARDDSIRVILQFQRPGRELPEEESGQEEFLFGYNGELQDRQVLSWPDNSSGATAAELVPTPPPTPTPPPATPPTSSLATVPMPSAVQWGTNSTGDGQFIYTTGVAAASDGSVYVADKNNNRIQKFTSEGVFVSKWGTLGTGNGLFSDPTGVAVVSDGSVYVANKNNSRIQKFSVGP